VAKSRADDFSVVAAEMPSRATDVLEPARKMAASGPGFSSLSRDRNHQ
jgi:hypothetical protein